MMVAIIDDGRPSARNDIPLHDVFAPCFPTMLPERRGADNLWKWLPEGRRRLAGSRLRSARRGATPAYEECYRDWHG